MIIKFVSMQKTVRKHLDQNSVSELGSTNSKHQSCKRRNKIKRNIDFIRFEQRRITQTWLLRGRLQTVVAHESSNIWFFLTVLYVISWYREFHIRVLVFVRGFKTSETINGRREIISTRMDLKAYVLTYFIQWYKLYLATCLEIKFPFTFLRSYIETYRAENLSFSSVSVCIESLKVL